MERKELFDIIKRWIADGGDAEEAQQAADAVTPIAEKGNVQAQLLLGHYYYHLDCDNPRFIPWFEKAATNGNEKAAGFLSDYYRYVADDLDAEEKKALGRKWHYRKIEILKKKADKGGATAAKALMNLYVYERPDDMTEKEGLATAIEWYDRRVDILRAKAENGNAKDKKKLADMLYWKNEVPEEILFDIRDRHGEAMELYKELTDTEGDGLSYYNLGHVYSREENGFEKAFECYLEAAELGHVAAYGDVASAYLDGEGVERDHAKAFEWFKKGADSGDCFSQMKLAECYKRGVGCEKDYTAAMELYQRMAARKGNNTGNAEYELGNMYLKGLGVEQDLRKAYDYFKQAAAHYNRAAENALNNKKFRDFRR